MSEQKWLVNTGQSRTIDLDGVTAVKISLVSGKVDVIGHDEPTTRVEVHSVGGRDLKIALVDGRLEIDHPQLSWDNWIEAFRSFTGKATADVSVLVPRDVELRLGTVNGNALVSGLSAGARLNTVGGDLTADSVTGELELNAVSGELSVLDHRGAVAVKSVSGDVTVSGALSRFTAETVSGNVFLDLDGVPDAIRNRTVSGDLTLRLDHGAAARFRINTVGGTLQLDDTLFRGAATKNFEYQSGPLDGHWAEVSASSVGGNVSIVRRAASSSDQSDQKAQPSA